MGKKSLTGSSPASTGPAGPRFEAQVGAHYLLTMLARAEPRGLPGSILDRVAFQRGDDGFPLDDVIIHAHDAATGTAVTLQIQVKREIKFTPSDAVFKKAASQIADAIRKPDFWTGRNGLAIATSRSSRYIDGVYQDVLRWARQVGSATLFFDRLNRPGTGNETMRKFVATLRRHLADSGGDTDEETVWKVLTRLQILVFDYTAEGSASEELSRERAVRVLPPTRAADASMLWSVLLDSALAVAADGGDRDRLRLVADLRAKSLAIGGDRRLAEIRAAVMEASQHALADMEDRIGSTSIARTERVEAVNAALDQGRYVEIRGDAGVGKSGVLKHFAEMFGIEGRVVILSPGRTVRGGWTPMAAMLGFKGRARDLLSDLASDGGAALFLDNLDSFSDEERLTVNDLVRAAAAVPGVSVVATARRNFGKEDPSWIDADAVKALSPAPVVVISELSNAEVEELRAAEPGLTALLADDHPARDVVRNLYRLSRLARRTDPDTAATTELDMAEQWWRSADGGQDGRRERHRVLRYLAATALGGAYVAEVSDQPSDAISDLLKSETLLDLGNDRVAFRHDVLRQWAIGNLLASDETALAQLTVTRPASAILERGVEIAARIELERRQAGPGWKTLLDQLSIEEAHGSWRRAVMLALVRGQGTAALDREATHLLENKAALLRELIRTVRAVDVEPISRLLTKMGADPVQIPPGVFMPATPAWIYLIEWLLKLGTGIPAQAIADVTEFYKGWMLGTLGHGPFLPEMLGWLHAWLVELEGEGGPGAEPRTYAGAFGYRDADGLISSLRTGLLMFANRRPDLAVDYLKRVRAYTNDHRVTSSIMTFYGTLPEAAPAELAALTAERLIAEPDGEKTPYRSRRRDEAFQFLDTHFLHASPSKGPFLDLLIQAPADGLALIRRLVAHAIAFEVGDEDAGDDGFRIAFEHGERFFPWTRTYRWARGDSNHNAMTCGLMALEAWGHRRIEAGENLDVILKDVLGPPGTSAAFLLVAVDLIISHWPNSLAAAVPFLGCPELVSVDRMRQGRDQLGLRDMFSVFGFRENASARDALAALKARPSRNAALERLLFAYAQPGRAGMRAELRTRLNSAAQRLGGPEARSNFADPRLMVQHELNLIDPANWPEQELEFPDGSKGPGRRYVSPPVEAAHLAGLAKGAALQMGAANLSAALLMALNDPTQSSPELAEKGVAWAQALRGPRTADAVQSDGDRDESAFMDGEGLRAAALITLRDGNGALVNAHGDWAEKVLLDALQAPEDVAHRMRGGLQFNPPATAFVGVAERYCRAPTAARLRTLLEMAARDNPAAARGFSAVAAKLAAVDERLPQALVRCAFVAAIKPSRRWNLAEADVARRGAAYDRRLVSAVDAEFAWLTDIGSKPAWPKFQAEGMQPVARRRRPGIRVGGAAADVRLSPGKTVAPRTYVDDQAAALWISALRPLMNVVERPWLREMAAAYADYSSALNGEGLGPDEEVSRESSEWNADYYPLLARTLVGLSEDERNALAVDRIIRLSDEPFFDVATEFLQAVDVVYFNQQALVVEAPQIRQQLIQRLRTSAGWKRLVGSRSSSVEIHLAPAIATVFFNTYTQFVGQTSCYLTPVSIDRFDPFLSQITNLASDGPSYFTALLTMDLLEVSPRGSLLPLLLGGAKAWLGAYRDDTVFWIDHSIAKRVCAWIGLIHQMEPTALRANSAERHVIDLILAALVRIGAPEARQLEAQLVAASDSAD